MNACYVYGTILSTEQRIGKTVDSASALDLRNLQSIEDKGMEERNKNIMLTKVQLSPLEQ